MNLKKLLTLSYDKNVGASDRVFRLVSGAAAASAGWLAHASFGMAGRLDRRSDSRSLGSANRGVPERVSTLASDEAARRGAPAARL